ncbi:NAD(P)H-binding protein [Chryseobacterium sp. GVT01B]|uniref:NAD(P)H-binding protein n=1 Tax=Chryseobacterium sp. GVT01B TaxID=2862675 RepID=UPI001CBBD5E7|nr:NAD(P)H-binding protein [Chryseobacterium sp. GVT01B]
MKAILIGASGATGKELLNRLLNNDAFDEVVALVRKPLPVKNQKLQTIIVDFEESWQWKDVVHGDVAFSCLGTTLRNVGSKKNQHRVDYDYQYEFAKIAKANKIPYFILVSSSTANHKSPIFYSRMKGELEKAITELKFKNLVVFRPGPLIRPNTDRIGERIGVNVICFFNKLGLFRKMKPLPVSDLADLMLDYALNPAERLDILESGRILNEIQLIKI